MNYWLVKSDPETYGWKDLVEDGSAMWEGVRNYQARNNLREMKKGDLVFVYESQGPKEITGIAEVVKEAYQDPTTEDSAWVAVDLQAIKALNPPVTLRQVKESNKLLKMKLVTNSRLSVMPVTAAEWKEILLLSKNV